ncbi:MAG TPA: hypothetical protein VGV92_08395 [Gammaproteobacteria bacterium]|nr:hypothetical protein [Gammaproteobacteria bacterium]
MGAENVVQHVVRHHPGAAVQCLPINGVNGAVCIKEMGGDAVHTFLNYLSVDTCGKNLTSISPNDPSLANVTWSMLADGTDAAVQMGMNVSWAFTNPSCYLPVFAANCFTTLYQFAPCAVKAALRTAADMSSQAEAPYLTVVGAGTGAAIGLVVGLSAAAMVLVCKGRKSPENTRLLERPVTEAVQSRWFNFWPSCCKKGSAVTASETTALNVQTERELTRAML